MQQKTNERFIIVVVAMEMSKVTTNEVKPLTLKANTNSPWKDVELNLSGEQIGFGKCLFPACPLGTDKVTVEEGHPQDNRLLLQTDISVVPSQKKNLLFLFVKVN